MTTATTAIERRVAPPGRWLGPEVVVPALAALAAIAVAIWLVLSSSAAQSSPTRLIGIALFAALAIWMFLSERYELTLSVLLLYLGLLDGFLKLKTGSSVVTLGRDVLLYAIAAGAIVRLVLRGSTIPRPPLLLLIVAWVCLCLAQIFNPSAVSIAHAAAGIRQHIEFVPLFFAGYFVLRSKNRLDGLFVLLIIVAALNGIVEEIQTHLTPQQLASWGPGYYSAEIFNGTGTNETFWVNGVEYVRPMGLGGAFGFGGMVGLVAVPGTLALLARGRRAGKAFWVAALGGPFVLLALIASQQRTAVVGAAVALFAYFALTLTSRRALIALVATVVVAGGGYGVYKEVNKVPTRYSSIAPGNVVSTTVNYRASTLALIPTYAVDYPLGAGMGSSGPAANSSVGGAVNKGAGLDAESEFTFLEVELGDPGLAIFAALTLVGLLFGLRLRRVAEPALQRDLMAVTAVYIAILACWVVSAVSAATPTSPYFWMATGVLVYWYREVHLRRIAVRGSRVRGLSFAP